MSHFRMPPQILRLVLLTLVILVTYVAARRLLTPPSFYRYGHYRADALGELASREPKFAGAKACDECHSEVGERQVKDKHKTISCESCHGPLRTHSKNPDVTPLKVGADICLRCHTADPARPTHQKQVVALDHYHEDRCTECHLPHQPNQSPAP